MKSLHSLLNSLYSLTRIDLFRDLARSVYNVERTKEKVNRVKGDLKKTKQAVNQKKAS